MKAVFKCDYCSKMGTEEEIKKHEPECPDNYDKKSCYTCIHKKLKLKNSKWICECMIGNEIPEEYIIQYCPSYERKANDDELATFLGSIFYNI